MNPEKLNAIIRKYIEKFVELNQMKTGELYKWKILPLAKPILEQLLATDDPKTISEKLEELRKTTSNLIENGKELHLCALHEYAQKEALEVRAILQALFEDDGGDLKRRQDKLSKFISDCAAMQAKYAPGKWTHEISLKTAIVLLFLYDPEHNYMYKATQAYAFADHAGFLDEWGAGRTFRLDIYYRMCDELLAFIKQHDALLNTNKSRYEANDGLYSDPELHLLVSDIIYCCSTYHLLDDIVPEHANTAEKRLARERRNKAEELYEKLLAAQARKEQLDRAKQILFETLVPGIKVMHKDKKYGAGEIIKIEETAYNNAVFTFIHVSFAEAKKANAFLPKAFADGTIVLENLEIMRQIRECAGVLAEVSNITEALKAAEAAYMPYKEYIS